MSAPTSSIRVLLADDNVDLTGALRRLLDLEPDIECVGCVDGANGVVDAVRRCRPHVLVLDLSMPGQATPVVLRELTTGFPELRTIVFSGYGDDDARIEESLEAGACGFVCKDRGTRHLVEAIRAAALVSAQSG